jgi:hypothetical protein
MKTSFFLCRSCPVKAMGGGFKLAANTIAATQTTVATNALRLK